MINCTFFSKSEMIQTIIVKGHANSAPIGQDIVCAGVSALIQNLAIGLGVAIEEPDIVIDSGNFKATLNDDYQKSVFVITEAFKISMQLLQDSYPDFIKVIENEEVT